MNAKTLKTNKQASKQKNPTKIPSSIYYKALDWTFKVIFQHHLDLGNFYLSLLFNTTGNF